MAKKKRSAKQRANDKRLGKMARMRATKSKPRKTRSKTVKRVKSKARRTLSMVKRRRSSTKRSSKGILGRIPLVSNPSFKKAAAGVGTAVIGVTLLSLIAPGIAANPIVKPVLALAGGDFLGLAAQLFTGGGLGNILGGGGSGNMEGMA